MIIAGRFNGPPGTGNGGYSSGLFASLAEGVPEVTLLRPPPLDVPLTAAGDGAVEDPAGELVATVRSVPPFPPGDLPAPTPAEARAAAAGYAGRADHPFPTCYVCGPARTDGLAIYPGPLPGGGVAAPFTAPAEVTRETVWAALDCPGGWSVLAPGRPYVLGRMAAMVDALPEPGSECVVVGAMVTSEGRRAQVVSGLYSPAGTLLAHARATWFAI
jgi:hypothetical protein